MKDSMTIHREELEKLSTQELDKILRSELDSENPKKETVLLLLSILEERDPTTSQNRPEGAERAFTERQRKEFAAPLETATKKNWKPKKWIGVAAAVVAIAFALLATVPQTVGAESIFEIIGRWTKDLFSFSDGTDTTNQEYVFKTDNDGLQQLYDAVVEQGVTDPVVPMWIPEGYELEELRTFRQPVSTKVYARYTMDNKYIQIMIEVQSEKVSNKYTKDDADVKQYDSNGVHYYLFANEDTWEAVWNNGNAECSLIIRDDENTLRKVLNSIQKENGYE